MTSVTNIIIANGSFWIPVLFGFLFLRLPPPNKKLAGDYKKIKYFLSGIYLFYALISLIALIINKDFNFDITIRLFVPLIAIFHIVLFSHVNILLINKPNFSSKMLSRALTVCFLFSFIYLVVFFNENFNPYYRGAYYAMYILLLILTVIFTIQFFKYYKRFKHALDNFYSETSHNHLKWVYVSQILVVITAGTVFLTTILPDYAMIAFMTITLAFYTYYAIRLIRFNFSTAYLDFGTDENDHFLEEDDEISDDAKENNDKPISLSFIELEEAVEEWVASKKYLEVDTTIISVANELNTNRTYLSNYINNYKQQTFKEWISELRIEEAKNLLISEPHLSISEISMNVGFTDKSNFGRNFSKLTGKTPSAWRAENKNNLTQQNE